MTSVYPMDYPFNMNNQGWPEPVYDPPYPHEFYYDNGKNTSEINSVTGLNDEYRPQLHSTQAVPLAIRRHTPASIHPTFQKPSSRNYSPSSTPRVTFKEDHPSTPPAHPTRSKRLPNHSPTSLDPDERPIKPMKDTAVYQATTSQNKVTQPKKSVSPLKPTQASPRFESDSFQQPPSRTRTTTNSSQPPPSRTRATTNSVQPPPSRTRMTTVSPRRPIRMELIPRSPFGISSRNSRPRQFIVEDYDREYPVTYSETIPKQIIAYREVPGVTTREMENYHMSKVRRVVHVRSPPVETIIYRT